MSNKKRSTRGPWPLKGTNQTAGANKNSVQSVGDSPASVQTGWGPNVE
jgi:hypothetical protein